jgi:Fibronectin type III domain
LRNGCRWLVVVVLTGIGLLWVSSSALAISGYVPGDSFGGPGEAAGELEAPEGVASDTTTGNVYVADAGSARVDEFDATHKFVRAWGWGVADGLSEFETCTLVCQKGIAGPGAGQFSKPSYIAVNNSTALTDMAKGDAYVGDSTNNTVQRFSEGGALEAEFAGICETLGEAQPCSGSTLVPFGELYGVAVDPAGDLWVYDTREGTMHLSEFDSAGHFVKSIVSERIPSPGGLAVDSQGTIYVTGRGASVVLRYSSETGAELSELSEQTGVTNEVTAIAIAPETSNVVADDGNRLDLYGPFGEEVKNKPRQTVTTDGFTESHGLAIDQDGTVVASVRSAAKLQIFNYVPLVPTVAEESASSIGSTEATVSAEVNPFGEPATYRVEYGVTQSYGGSTPESSIGAPSEAVSVQTTLVGLQPNTEYHFRVVAKSASGTTVGADRMFRTTTTSPGPVVQLPDGRAYELVSGLGAPGEAYVPLASITPPRNELVPSVLPFRASENGGAVAYVGDPGATGGNGLTGNGLGNEFLARRSSQAGWISADITPHVAEPGEGEQNASYEAFSDDLSIGFFSALATPKFSANANPAGPSEQCGVLFAFTSSTTQALFDETQGAGSRACGLPEEGDYTAQSLLFAGANRGTATVAADSQRLVQTPAPLTFGDRRATEKEEGNNIYVSTDGHLHVVGILPSGEHSADAVFGSTSGEPLTQRQSRPGDFSNVISDDGSRIFWTALEPAEEAGERVSERIQALYVREAATSASARTLQLDASQVPAGGGTKEAEERAERSGGGRFWTATPDGAKVFFTDCSRLTEDSTAENAEGCSHTIGSGNVSTGNDLYEYDFTKPSGARLTDLTVDAGVSDPLGADVQGVIGTSEDGEYVYFVANGVLAGANSDGAAPTSGQPNLYLRHGRATIFVTQLENSDDRREIGSGGAIGDWRPDLGYRTAAVSPDGLHLVFQSTRRLTNFDNQGVLEVLTYSSEGPGHVTCVSCVPGGTTAGRQGSYLYASLNPTYLQRWMSSDGNRVFFDSDERLVPRDSNGVQDVYEWERAGHGSCTSEPGCIYLLSGGTSATRSYFLDADVIGDNVFFTHRGELGLAEPNSEQNVVLDARVDGGFSVPPAGECASCEPSPPTPTFSHSPAATFTGAGNVAPSEGVERRSKTPAQVRAERLTKALKACRAKHNHAKRLACEKQARKRFGPLHKAKTHKQKKKTGKAKKSASRGGGRR